MKTLISLFFDILEVVSFAFCILSLTYSNYVYGYVFKKIMCMDGYSFFFLINVWVFLSVKNMLDLLQIAHIIYNYNATRDDKWSASNMNPL